ncbi:MAG: LysR family transcriptional regulator [Candidatus Hydrogenedentes bacterium]|nr:LysR family transcriptional regulator [Candidatus Hydrogenedentota bacterium]
MTFEGLRCFCAVVELRSFRKAAEKVHRSQPAVSQQIKALELEAGRALLERRQCRPTAAGAIVYERAQQILQGIDGLSRELADAGGAEQRELRVGTSDTTALYVLPSVLRRFTEAMPQTNVILINRNSDEIARLTAGGELDLGIVTLPQLQHGLEVQPLFEQRLVLAVPANSPLAKRRKLALADLADTPMLLLDRGTRTGQKLYAYFAANHFTPRVILHSGSFEVVKRYVAEGIGVSFLPEESLGEAEPRIVAAPLKGLPAIETGVIWRRGAYRTRAEAAFISMLEPRERT